jgi:hypothetical protein
VADQLAGGDILLAKWVRRLTNWSRKQVTAEVWRDQVVPLLRDPLAAQKTPLVALEAGGGQITALLSLADWTMRVPIDRHGVALWQPPEREVLPDDCARCTQVEACRALAPGNAAALLWRRLGLVDARGVPGFRGRIVSFFSQGDGLAVAAALEEESYPIADLIYDLADLDAGFRFCGDDSNRWGGRLAEVCRARYGIQSIPGYLENGVPAKYGAGAERVVAAVHRDPADKHRWVTVSLGLGDIDRIIIEWRSLLRRIAHAPELEAPRWRELQAAARRTLNETESPTATDLPPLEFSQTRRIDHRLQLRRH